MAALHDAGGDGRSMPLGEARRSRRRPTQGAGRPLAAKLLPRQAGQLLGRARPRSCTRPARQPDPRPRPRPFVRTAPCSWSPRRSSSRRCVRCRQRIIVKHIEGRAVYLTEAAVPVFVAERRRIAASGRLTRERERWLRLAAAAGAPVQSQARLAAARLLGGGGRRRPDALPDHGRPRVQSRQTRPRLGGGVAYPAREGDGPVPRRRLAAAASGRPRRDVPRRRRRPSYAESRRSPATQSLSARPAATSVERTIG